MIKRAVALVLTLAVLAAYQLPTVMAAAQHTGEISGMSVAEGKPVTNVLVRLRNVDSGQLVGDVTTSANGEFRFTGLPPGNFVVETVAANGTLLGISARISLGAMVVNAVVVPTSTAAAVAAGIATEPNQVTLGAGAQSAASAAPTVAPSGPGAFFASAFRVLIVAAFAIVVVAAVAGPDDSGRSQ